MSKLAFLAFVAVATSSAVAAVYYVSPTSFEANSSTPPILVSAAPEQAVTQLRSIRLDHYFRQMAPPNETLPNFVQMRASTISPLVTQYDLFISQDNPLRIIANVAPAGNGQSEVEIDVLLPASKFRTNAALHPYEVEQVSSMIDFVVTDYVSSVLKAQRPLSPDELGKELEKRFDFKNRQADAMGDRIGKALEMSYQSDLEAWVRQQELNDAYRRNAHRKMVDQTERSAEAAGLAAQGAAMDAAQAADRAAEEARKAAELASNPTPNFGEPTAR